MVRGQDNTHSGSTILTSVDALVKYEYIREDEVTRFMKYVDRGMVAPELITGTIRYHQRIEAGETGISSSDDDALQRSKLQAMISIWRAVKWKGTLVD